MPPPEPRAPAKRADARRNRDKILTAARAAFTDADHEISMAEVARRAGVGMATLYRNYPGRRELLEALYADEVNALCEAATSIQAQTPGTALSAWLQRCFDFATRKHRVVTELLKTPETGLPILGESRARVMAAGRPLLLAAQRSHEAREDLTLEHIADLIVAVASIKSDPGYLEPIVQTALAGIRLPIAAKPEHA